MGGSGVRSGCSRARSFARRIRHRDRLVLGLMAGTSGDGIDAACVRIKGAGAAMAVELLWHRHRSFAPALRRRLVAAMAPAATTTEELARLHADLGDAFASAACEAIRSAQRRQRPSLIGLAGQTVCHLPDRRRGRTVTLQLGEPARVAARTGLATVADFRQSDVAAGGQGAPLVPWTDWVLFRHEATGRAFQNVGGIANVTWLTPGAEAGDVIAFDTGPGNMVIDALAAHLSKGRQRMDRHGARAARGRVLHEVLEAWLKHPFFRQRPPKSTGRETFGRPFVDAELERLSAASTSPDDWLATATALTARSIARSYRRFLPGFAFWGAQPTGSHPPIRRRRPRGGVTSSGRARTGRGAARAEARGSGPVETRGSGRGQARGAWPAELIVCGGGALNATLMAMLSAELPGVAVRSIASFGIPCQAKEAVSFAMLAAACVDGVPANLPNVTGATRPAVLGRIVLP